MDGRVAHAKIPFPYNVIEGAGMGYAFGIAATSPWHFITAPAGARLATVAMNVPRTAGSFAVFTGLFETFSEGVAHVRRKEDPLNNILGGASASGFLSLRRGPRAASTAFLGAGLLFACMDGVLLVFQGIEARQRQQQQQLQNHPEYVNASQVEVLEAAKAGTGYLGRWFRRKKGRKSDDKGGTTVLESVDTSPPPMPAFERTNY